MSADVDDGLLISSSGVALPFSCGDIMPSPLPDGVFWSPMVVGEGNGGSSSKESAAIFFLGCCMVRCHGFVVGGDAGLKSAPGSGLKRHDMDLEWWRPDCPDCLSGSFLEAGGLRRLPSSETPFIVGVLIDRGTRLD